MAKLENLGEVTALAVAGDEQDVEGIVDVCVPDADNAFWQVTYKDGRVLIASQSVPIVVYATNPFLVPKGDDNIEETEL